jgi:hypothetical protein
MDFRIRSGSTPKCHGSATLVLSISRGISPGEPPRHAQVPDSPDVAAEATALPGAPHARLHGGGELRVLPARPLPLHHLWGVTLQAHDRLDNQLSSTYGFISFLWWWGGGGGMAGFIQLA